MDTVFAVLQGWSVAEALRFSRWGYAAVNGAHILGIALLLGSVIPMNLRLLGLWRDMPRDRVVGMLAPVAAAGLGLAVTMGFLLFAVRAAEYAALDVFLLKMAFVSIGTLAAITAHVRYGWWLDRAPQTAARAHAFVSLLCWIAALSCGRLIAFVEA